MRLLCCYLLLLLLPASAIALEITSISPVAASPGAPVVLTGGPFRAETRILFGNTEIIPENAAGDLRFTVPPLTEGEYAVAVRGGEGRPTPVTKFRIVAPVPRLDSISPTSLDACSIQQGQTVLLSGSFPAGAKVLLDGAVVPVQKMGENEIILSLPPLKGGLHRFEVAGGGEGRSLPHAIHVVQAPKIVDVAEGKDQVTSYEVIVRGENFLYDSSLIVNGAPLRRAVEGKTAESYSALERVGGEDYVRYLDCTTLVYRRHPVTREAETLTLQVVNPGGEQSPVYVVVIP